MATSTFFPGVLASFDVCSELIEQVINNVGCEDLDALLLSEGRSLWGHPDIEGQDGGELLLDLCLINGQDLPAARLAMRDLRRAFTTLPVSAAGEDRLNNTWATVRPGIESGLRQALSAEDLAALRTAFATIRKHVTPLIESEGDDASQ